MDEYVLYLRKSKGRTGIARQRTVTTGHVRRLGGTVIAEYCDTDATAFQRIGGDRPEREDFDAMLAHLRSAPGVHVAAWHADRLLRNAGDTELLIGACAAGGHLIETPRGGSYDLSTASGRKRLRGDANDASFEVDHLIERVSEQKAEAAAAGMWLGGPVPFGWAKDAAGRLAIRPAEADAIRDATGAVLDGESLHAIARQWSAAGLVTRSGREWLPGQVRRVLLRARNAGLHVWQGEVTGVAGDWPAIVPEARWRACEALLTDPSRRTTTGTDRRWLGSGLYLCGTCGQPLLIGTAGGDGRPRRKVYRCRLRQHVARDAASLDACVGAHVVARMERPDVAAKLVTPGADLSTLMAELAATGAEIRDIAARKVAGKITLDQVEMMTGPLMERQAQLRSRLAAASRPSPLEAFAGPEPPADVWEALDLRHKRAVVAELMKVTVLPAPRGRPRGWRPGSPYFDADSVIVEFRA